MKHQLSAICVISLYLTKDPSNYLGLQLIKAKMRYSLRKLVLAGPLILQPQVDGYMGSILVHFKIRK